MEKFILRVLVIVLLGGVVGLFAMSRSKVMLHLPPANTTNTGQTTGNTSTPPAPTPAQTSSSGPAEETPAQPESTGPAASTGAAPTPETPTNTAATPKPAAPKGTVEDYFITLDQAKEMLAQGDAIFIDARPFVEFREGHIRGAMHVDKRYFDGAAPKKVRDYLPGRPVVVYCHGAECTDSEAVVKRLIALNLGIGPYYIIRDGWPGWKERNKTDPGGFPIDVGGEVGFE